MTKKEDTFAVKISLSRYVSDDNGFYELFIFKEVRSGKEKIKKSIKIGIKQLQNFIERTLEGKEE